MKSPIIRKFVSLILLLAIISAGSYIYGIISNPCSIPISLKIDFIDPHFGLKHEESYKALEKAISNWENAIGTDLFTLSSTSKADINISFIYDERQASTVALNKIQDEINLNEESYESYKRIYSKKEAEYENLKANYESKVDEFNSGSKRPSQAEINEVEQMRLKLNSLAHEINSLVEKLNSLATEVHMRVENYNSISGELEEEFDQGVYESDGLNRKITIYQFKDVNQLEFTFTHELGHALRLDHTADENSLMYYLNTRKNQEILSSDIAELKETCKLK